MNAHTLASAVVPASRVLEDRATILEPLARTMKATQAAILRLAEGNAAGFDDCQRRAASEAQALIYAVEGTPIPAGSRVPECPYASPNVPEGYATTWGYIESTNPGYLDEFHHSVEHKKA